MRQKIEEYNEKYRVMFFDSSGHIRHLFLDAPSAAGAKKLCRDMAGYKVRVLSVEHIGNSRAA